MYLGYGFQELFVVFLLSRFGDKQFSVRTKCLRLDYIYPIKTILIQCRN